MKSRASGSRTRCRPPNATRYRGLYLVEPVPVEIVARRWPLHTFARRAALIAAGAAIVWLVLAA